MTRPAQLPITTAEREVLQALADGLTLKELAYRRGVVYSTPAKQMADARIKLGENSTEHAVAIGFRTGLLEK